MPNLFQSQPTMPIPNAPVMPSPMMQNPSQIPPAPPRKPMNIMMIAAIGGGILALILLIVVLLTPSPKSSGTDVSLTPTVSPSPTTVPTPTITPTPAPPLHSLAITDKATIKYPDTWIPITEIPARYQNAEGSPQNKLFSQKCSGPILQNKALPSTIIAFEIYDSYATNPTFCWSNGNFNDVYYRKISTFSDKDIKVVKWKPNDIFENGVLKRATWGKNLVETYTKTSDELRTSVSMTLVFEEGIDILAETDFDMMIQNLILKTRGQVDPVSTWVPASNNGGSVRIPPTWWSDSVNSGSDVILLINPTRPDSGSSSAYSFTYTKRTVETVIKDLTDKLQMTNVEQTTEKLPSSYSIIKLTGTSGGKKIEISIADRNQGVYILQDYGTQADHDTIFAQMKGTLSF